jgi:hypothetical protein
MHSPLKSEPSGMILYSKKAEKWGGSNKPNTAWSRDQEGPDFYEFFDTKIIKIGPVMAEIQKPCRVTVWVGEFRTIALGMFSACYAGRKTSSFTT